MIQKAACKAGFLQLLQEPRFQHLFATPIFSISGTPFIMSSSEALLPVPWEPSPPQTVGMIEIKTSRRE